MIRLVFLRRIDNLSDLWIKSFEGTATGAGKPLFPSKTQTETTKQQTAGGKTSEHSRKQSLQEWYQTTALHRIHWEHIQQSTCRSCRTTWREPRMLIFAALWGLQHQKAWPNTRGVWLLRYIQWHIPDRRLTSRTGSDKQSLGHITSLLQGNGCHCWRHTAHVPLLQSHRRALEISNISLAWRQWC